MASLCLLSQALCLFISVASASSELLRPRSNNGLAITPPMGWNPYNHYFCAPNESIIHSNAQALVDLGLKDRGYRYATVDCGWTLQDRDAAGELMWNPALFPSGYPDLGNFIHSLGLLFGVYSDGGINMCNDSEPAQAGSLFHESTDANTFASWGADLLKYDNCYSDAAAGYPVSTFTPDVSPEPRYANMTNAILATGRPILLQFCEWGVDFPSAWAPALGNSWRIANDIIATYSTIPRILNQAVPQTSFAGPEHWLDLDMMLVGNKVFTIPEEQTHFSLWAIIKSPLMIGAALKDNYTSISAASLAILKNSDVIGYNQDSLGVAASFRRRWTEDYEIWAGPLSGGRTVVAIINLKVVARTLTLDLPDVGFQTAGSVKDIWNEVNASNVVTSYTGAVEAHGTLLLELNQTIAAGQYALSDAVVSGYTATFNNIYGKTSSSNYTLVVTYSTAPDSATTITVNNAQHTLAAGAKSFNTTMSLLAANNNTLKITSNPLPESITITAPPQSFYPSTAFSLVGGSTRVSCSTGLCTPVGSKIGYLSPTGSASANITSPSSSTTTSDPSNPKFLEIYFCNNDIATTTAFTTGTNTRNLTISVNREVTRIEVPLSGRSSELFSPGLGWQDTGTFGVLTTGWVNGVNMVVIGNEFGNEGLISYGADFVGLGVLW